MASALLNGLVSFWKLDEASGNALDVHGSNELTANGTSIASVAGLIGNARDFERDNFDQYFSISNASQTLLSPGDSDFTIAGWIKLESKSNFSQHELVAKFNTTGNQREYRLFYLQGDDAFRFTVSPDGSASVTDLNASTFGSPSLGTWYFICAWHDAVNNTINISVNDGTTDSTTHSTGVFQGTADYTMGSAPSSLSFLDGTLDHWGFWNRVLTSEERTDLYNSGSGLAYPLFTNGAATIIPMRMMMGIGV
jgi:hypothetical protein